MKIVAAAYLHGFGGAEKQLIMLCNKMVERNHDVTIVLISGGNIAYPLDERVKVVSILCAESKYKVISIFRRFLYLRRVLRELQADLIVNFNMQSACMLSFLDKSKIGKVVYSERGDPGDFEYSGILGIIRKLTFPFIDGFVFQTYGARDFFKSHKILSKSVVIPNACFLQNVQRFAGIRQAKIVSIGRLHPQKNQALLIKAFAMVHKVLPSYVLHIYGEGELREQLMNLSKELGIESNVYFKGTSKTVLKEIEDASLFVLSSDFEGIPNVLIEAMAIGLPCVSTDCKPGGARLLINDGVNGYITPIGDVVSLGNTMLHVLQDFALSEKLGNEATKITDTLSPENIYNKWEFFFHELLKKKR